MREIEADNEFNKLKKHAFDNVNPFIDSNVSAANEHAPEIERNNRVIKERVRAECGHQPHEKLPESSIVIIAHESVKWSNTHSAKGEILTSIASRTVIERRTVDCDEQCVTEPDTCVSSHEELKPENGMQKRVKNCLHLHSDDSHQAEH